MRAGYLGWLALALSVGTGVSAAADLDPIAQATARRLAVQTCASCHGVHGVSRLRNMPQLAAQNANYVVMKLRDFRSLTRRDAGAVSHMWGMARKLDDATIDALAQYYARQRPASGVPANSALAARGREIYEHGSDSAGVPACVTCHGPFGHGSADFPRLTGQHARYILKQLASFKNNMPAIATLHGVAQGLQRQQLRAVAAYLDDEALP
jgi:cytochrome c553